LTKTQATIIAMIADGRRNTEIVQHTGKTPDYVSRVRRRLKQEPQLFERPEVIDEKKRLPKVAQEKAPAVAEKKKRDWSGDVSCLKCDSIFFSEDRRHNRICPKCKNDYIHSVMVESTRANLKTSLRDFGPHKM